MVFAVILGGLALVSLALTLWQFLAGSRFALHARMHHNGYAPSVTLLKPLKGADSETRSCLASWLEQKYTGPWQV
ncbi:MAG TPA: hypothetical protein VHH73_16265, partial [Verrucomicrobiae bacterium]|nr:hypothetical protein [Verrucomicrobiae bacterium]